MPMGWEVGLTAVFGVPKLTDLAGRRFGRLLAIERVGTVPRPPRMALPVRLRQQMRDAHERPRPNPKLRASNSRSALLINFCKCDSSTASTSFAWPVPAAVFNPMRSVTFFTRHSGCRLLLRGDERRYEITGVSRAG